MKKLLQIVLITGLMLNFACEGPEGPAGPIGETGPVGPRGPEGEDAQTATVLEFSLDFQFEERDSSYFAVSPPLEELGVVDSDVILAYNLFAYFPEDELAFWSPLPQTITVEEGSFTLDYAVSRVAAYFFIDTEIEWTSLEVTRRDELTKGHWMRLVIVPGEYVAENQRTLNTEGQLKSLSYKEVMKKFNLSEKDVKKIQIK